MLFYLIILWTNGEQEYYLSARSPRREQLFGLLLEPSQLLIVLLGALLLLASPLQFSVFKHDAYRSIAMVCIICILCSQYLLGTTGKRLPRAYVLCAIAISGWGALAAAWASAAQQASLFALLPPLLFLTAPFLAGCWRARPVVTSLSLAALALVLFSTDAVMAVASQLSGDTPYRMPWMSPVQAYLFYNSRDANQFHTLLIWTGLPCLWLASQATITRVQSRLLTALGLVIPALGLFLILNNKGDGALLAVAVGCITSAFVLHGPWQRILAVFALGLGIGALVFVIYNTATTGGLFGDVVTRNLQEFSATKDGGRLHNWARHLESIQRNGLWHGAGYRAIPSGAKQCDPHNVVVALGYWLGIPGLLLIGAWVSSLNWKLNNHPPIVQVLLPGTFASLAVYQLVDAIWGFPPSFVLLCLLFGIVCPLLEPGDPSWDKALPMNRNWSLMGIALAALFFVLAQQPGFNAGHPARRSCLMAFGTTMQVKFGELAGSGSNGSGAELR